MTPEQQSERERERRRACSGLPDSSKELRQFNGTENAAPDCDKITSFAWQKRLTVYLQRWKRLESKKARKRQCITFCIDGIGVALQHAFSIGGDRIQTMHTMQQQASNRTRAFHEMLQSSQVTVHPKRTCFQTSKSDGTDRCEFHSTVQCRQGQSEENPKWSSNGSYFFLEDQASEIGNDLMQLLALSEPRSLTTLFAIWSSRTGVGFPWNPNSLKCGLARNHTIAI